MNARASRDWRLLMPTLIVARCARGLGLAARFAALAGFVAGCAIPDFGG